MTPDPADAVERFEVAWQQGVPPRLELFLPSGDPSRRKDLLLELVAIDLECRWHHADAIGGTTWLLEDYVLQFPELGPLDQLSAELIVEEYRVRHRWGDAPATDLYLRRLPAQAAVLAELLNRMDERLSAEQARQRVQPRLAIPLAMPVTPLHPDATLVIPHSANGEPNPPRGEGTDRQTGNGFALPAPAQLPAASAGLTVAGLVETLRQSSLLSTAHMEELVGGSLKRFVDVHALAGELLGRDWLTPYQVTQLLQGRAHELTLGSYRLLERLGSGGAGQVFKARHQKLNRLVALKVLHDELLTDAECVGRFLREIQIVSQLDHPHLIPAYDAGPVGNSYFLAMKFVEGMDLGRLVKKGGPLLLTQACEYVRQAALGLQHLHEHGCDSCLYVSRPGLASWHMEGGRRGPPG